MNHIFKIIWNASLGRWIAVQETAKGKTKTKASKNTVLTQHHQSSAHFSIHIILKCLLASNCIFSSCTYAGTQVGTGSASGLGAIAISDLPGYRAYANTQDAIAIGNASSVNGIRSAAIGVWANANGNNSLALGSFAKSNSLKSTAIGNETFASGEIATAIGSHSKAVGNYTTAIGNAAVTNAAYALAIGSDSQAMAEKTTAVGSFAKATVSGSTAIGNYATAGHNNASALGTNSNASGSASVALGSTSKASGNSAIALGSTATATGDFSTSIGPYANVSSARSIALGYNSNVSANDSIAIGNSANANIINSAALGKNSKTTAAVSTSGITLDNKSYIFAGAAPVGVVSVGNTTDKRQIQNVAAGQISSSSTDAINGSQLFATNQALTDLASSLPEVAAGANVVSVGKTVGANGQNIYTVNAKGTTATSGSSALTVTANAPDANHVTNYAIDLSQKTKDSLTSADQALQSVVTQIDGKDVKKIDKASTTANFITGKNINLEDDGSGSIKVSTANDVNFQNFTVTGNSIVNNLTSTGDVKLGNTFAVNKAGDAHYSGPINASDSIVNKAYVDGLSTGSKTEVEQGKNITVASKTGTEGQTIYTVVTNDDVDFKNVNVNGTTITSNGLKLENGPSITQNGIDASNKIVTNVIAGNISATSKDAINGAQLYALGNNVGHLFGGNAQYINNQMTWSNIGGTGKNTIDEAIKYVNNQAVNANSGWKVSTDSGLNATSDVKSGDTLSIKGDNKSGVTVTNTGNDITVGLDSKVTIGQGNNSVSIDGNTGKIDTGSIKIDGSSGNISAGQVLVNGNTGTINGLTNTTWDPNNIVSGQAATEDQLRLAVMNVAGSKSTVTNGDNIVVSTKKNADGSTNYQVATNKDVRFDSVTIGMTIIDQDGINAGGQKISNVAAGVISSASMDAINASQLYAANSQIYNHLGGGANYATNTGPIYKVAGETQNNVGDALNALDKRDNQLDQKITNINEQLNQTFYDAHKRIGDIEKRANAGIASAMSLEAAPFVAGKWTYAAGVGYHGGESAVGATLRKTADNGRWSLTGGIAVATQGDPSFRVGVSGIID